MIEHEMKERAEAEGISLEALRERSKAMFRDFKKEPPSKAEIAHMERFARARAASWTPACEHDTENPWQ